jgi:hypothetical protein
MHLINCSLKVTPLAKSEEVLNRPKGADKRRLRSDLIDVVPNSVREVNSLGNR